MRELPSGTVTFLFTDIEGSTRLLDGLGEEYAQALAKHRRVLREAFDRHRGVEVDTEGDAFFVAFSRASDAIAAAEEAQARLELPVRMGIHTGESQLTDEGYVGIDVHRAARICAAGHAGQVLVSQTTRDLVQTELCDLGDHRLKDLSAPERIYQLGDREFPPLRTLYQTNLPVQPTPLVGREAEIAQVIERLETARLVTLTGPGGVGKTRLALQAAADANERYPDGVFFVGLQAVRDAELVLPAVSKALGADEDLARWIGPRRLLLVLDNLEQVVDCGPALGELLSEATRLELLCTSREPLRVYGESEYPVEPLPVDEGVELFRQRAIDSEPVEAVRAICARLDSLPLAIELAAARTRVLAPPALLERLDRALPLLAHGPRDASVGGRTLRATIEWSYDLLDADERVLFDRLGVFAGGCTLEEAERVAEATLEKMESLLEKAMLRRAGERYSMLQLVREFALDRLRERGQVDQTMNMFANVLLLAGEDESVRNDLDNWRALADWGVVKADADTALRIAILGRRYRPELAEILFWAYRALGERGEEASQLTRARLLTVIAVSHMFRGEFDSSTAAHERAIEIFREERIDEDLEDALSMFGQTLKHAGRDDDAERALREALGVSMRRGGAGSPFGPLHALGELERDRGNLAAARELFERAIASAKEHGRWDHVYTSSLRHGLGDLALEEDDPERAREWYLDALRIARPSDGHYGILHCVAGLAAVAAVQERPDEAAALWAAAQRYGELRGTALGKLERERYLARLEVVPAELLAAARERWKDATIDEIEEAAAGS
jgi:predicted ATPase